MPHISRFSRCGALPLLQSLTPRAGQGAVSCFGPDPTFANPGQTWGIPGSCDYSGAGGRSSVRYFGTSAWAFFLNSASPASSIFGGGVARVATLDLVAQHRLARTGVVSLQVLQEYFVAVTRKLHVDASVARRKIELLAEFDIVTPDVADILAAIDLHRLHGFSFWDALVLRAAKQSGCNVLFSENFHEAREIDGVRIVNPFR